MGMAALAEPQTIKISSKRQITIPAKIYQEAGFGEYALCTWTDQGLLLQPLDVDDEDVTVGILRDLMHEGYEGEELLEKYSAMKARIRPLARLAVEKADREAEDPCNWGLKSNDLFS